MSYIVKGIKWDTDGDQEVFDSLPQKITLPEHFSKENYMDEGGNFGEFENDEMLDDISDWISNAYGFCHGGFTLLEKKSLLTLFRKALTGIQTNIRKLFISLHKKPTFKENFPKENHEEENANFGTAIDETVMEAISNRLLDEHECCHNNSAISEKEPDDLVETNMGSIPREDYLDIRAQQYGFDDYEDMQRQGYSLDA